MTILELENRTGLDRATIRYYEREGLITPSRKDNSYRDYSDTDLQEILKIKLLRQLDLPLNQIKALQEGSADIAYVLRQQSAVLSQQVASMERAAEICREISNTAVSYNSLNAAEYLEKMNTPETACESPANPLPRKRASVAEYHPVRRYMARIADYSIVRITIQFLLIVVLRIRPYEDLLSWIVSYGTPFLCVPLLALSLNKFGTTPGKWLMGIRVEAFVGRKLAFRDALAREWNALRYGYGFGIPFWSTWRMYKSYKDYSDRMDLNQDMGVDYIFTIWYVRKKAVFAAVCAFLLCVSCINAGDLIKPRYRGNDLTVAEFAENFNYYAEVLDYSHSMNPDGTWYVSPAVQNGTTVDVVLSKQEKANEPFHFETEGERVTRITYQNAWQEVFMLTPMNNKMLTGVLTAIMSQNGVGLSELYKFLELMDSYSDEQTASIHYENVEIHWTIETENCINSNGTFFADDDAKPSRVTFALEIIITET